MRRPELEVEQGSDESEGPMSDEGPGAELGQDGWSHEHVDCTATEELRELTVKSEQYEASPGSVDDYQTWLDECQLRLTRIYAEALEAWMEKEEGPLAIQEGTTMSSEHPQRIWDGVEGLRLVLKRINLEQTTPDPLATEVQAGVEPETEEVLQTRIIANAQVMADWETWSAPTEVELQGLIVEKEALEHSNQKALENLQAQGYKVTIIPSKVIYSLQAPGGRKKCRLVACGNFLSHMEGTKHEHKQVVYTASKGIEALRTALA